MENVRIGIVGLGGMGQAHVQNVKKINEARLAAVSDVDAQVAESVGKTHGVRWFTDYNEMMKSGLIDAVIVATPHYFHPAVALSAFAQGLHVLAEKPLAVTVGEADRMLAAAKKAGRILSVMHQMRTLPVMRAARKVAESGAIGTIIRTLLVEPNFRTQAYYDSGTWRATWAGEGGGVIINQAPHFIDMLILLAGLPVRIEAKTRARLHKIEVEDEVSAILEYSNGAWGYFYTSTNELPRGAEMEIAGEKGKLVFRDNELRFCSFPDEVSKFAYSSPDMWGAMEARNETILLPDCDSGHCEIIVNFCRAILHGEPLISSGEDGLKTIEFINAVILSGHKNKPVDIPVDRKEYDDLLSELKKSSKPKERVNVQRIADPRFGK